jgi:hypothetical protein
MSTGRAAGERRIQRVTREEAEALCAKNAAEHPDRKVAQWRAQKQEDGTWGVIRIGLPPTPETTPEQQADERPPTPDDPRTAAMQNLGPNIGPVV